jgi:hypothetical protein
MNVRANDVARFTRHLNLVLIMMFPRMTSYVVGYILRDDNALLLVLFKR